MGKSKKRGLNTKGKNNIFSQLSQEFVSREDAIQFVISHNDDKASITKLINLFGITTEELLEHGLDYDSLVLYKGIL